MRIVRVNQRGNITSESQILKRRKCGRIVAVCKSVDVRRRLEKGEGKEKVRMMNITKEAADLTRTNAGRRQSFTCKKRVKYPGTRGT